MNEQDKKNFTDWWHSDEDHSVNNDFRQDSYAYWAWAGYQVACKHRDAQPKQGQQEPSGWYLHTMHLEGGQTRKVATEVEVHPFGVPGRDFSSTYSVTTEPIYTTPPAAQGQQEAWNTVHSAVVSSIEKCKYATGMHAQIDTYVNAVQITHDAMGTDTTPPAAPDVPHLVDSVWAEYEDSVKNKWPFRREHVENAIRAALAKHGGA